MKLGVVGLDGSGKQTVDVSEIHRTIANISEVYECLQPFEQKELMQLILQGAEINEREMVLEIRTGVCLQIAEAPEGKVGANGTVRFEPPNWLPGLLPQSVSVDKSYVRLPSLDMRRRKETRTRTRIADGRHATAEIWQGMIDDGTVINRSQLARRLGVSRARVTKALASASTLQINPPAA